MASLEAHVTCHCLATAWHVVKLYTFCLILSALLSSVMSSASVDLMDSVQTLWFHTETDQQGFIAIHVSYCICDVQGLEYKH